jgi:hypothetical protein
MKIVERNLIDTDRWDALVSASGSSDVFSLSFYLDIVAENWCIFVDDDYTRGIALPYVTRLGIKLCYTPTFVRYLEWYGDSMDDFRFMSEMKHHFPSGRLYTKHKIRTRKLKRRIYQVLSASEEKEFSPQTAKMLEKFERSELNLEWDTNEDEIIRLLRTDSPVKANALDRKTMKVLQELVEQLKQKGFLKTLNVTVGTTFLGGVFLIEFNGKLLQLRSAFTRSAKEMGAMYGVLEKAIQTAREQEMLFDFGGSNAESIKRVHHYLGGEDQKYYVINWDNTPSWYKFLMKLRNIFKRNASF